MYQIILLSLLFARGNNLCLFVIFLEDSKCIDKKPAAEVCNCDDLEQTKEGHWETPWCSDQKCYTRQKYEPCKGKENRFSLGDETYCWEGKRHISCPIKIGSIPKIMALLLEIFLLI